MFRYRTHLTFRVSSWRLRPFLCLYCEFECSGVYQRFMKDHFHLNVNIDVLMLKTLKIVFGIFMKVTFIQILTLGMWIFWNMRTVHEGFSLFECSHCIGIINVLLQNILITFTVTSWRATSVFMQLWWMFWCVSVIYDRPLPFWCSRVDDGIFMKVVFIWNMNVLKLETM